MGENDTSKITTKQKKQIKITTSVDDSTFDCLSRMSKESNTPCSEVIRKALHFYHENRMIPMEKCRTYLKLLSGGEHIVLDIDHWFLFLETMQSIGNQDAYWVKNKDIARANGELIKDSVHSVEDVLIKIELFNYYTLTKQSENDFTLLLRSEHSKKFVMVLLEEMLSSMGLKAEIKANFIKISVHVV